MFVVLQCLFSKACAKLKAYANAGNAVVRAQEVICVWMQIHNGCFFQGMRDIPASCLIANPPYIPAPDANILMPALHGGEDGANLTRVNT